MILAVPGKNIGTDNYRQPVRKLIDEDKLKLKLQRSSLSLSKSVI